MDDFFEKHDYGHLVLYAFGEQTKGFSVEDLYQAFKARMLAEMAEEKEN